MDQNRIAEIFEEIALLLELKGENPFKARAYSAAARTLQTTSLNLAELAAAGRLAEVPSLGPALQTKVHQLLTTGRLPYYEDLKASFPPTLPELFHLSGLGPKKIRLLYDELGVDSLAALQTACEQGRVAHVKGLGAKTQQNILAALAQRQATSGLHRLGDVLGWAEALRQHLRDMAAAHQVAVAGSFRRGKEVLKDLDILVSSARSAEVMDAFVAFPGVRTVAARGDTKCSVVLDAGLACDLRVVPDASFPTALHHFTGSKEHNVAMRQRAIEAGLKLSEWGLFETLPNGSERPLPCSSEADVFRHLGLAEIPPELRENTGEIEAAASGTVPRLIEWTDLRGTFHNHTTASDGRSSLADLAEAAREHGLEYLGIADHSQSSVQAHGLSPERLLAQIEEIRALNRSSDDICLFAGCEVDILRDGSLDYPNDLLAQLDYVVASIHSSFLKDEHAMTARLVRAAENPFVTMLGHLTGRLLLEREGYPINHQKVIDACAATGTMIELNASPYRLEMDWRWWHLARDRGVLCAINPDAHHVDQLGYLRLGVTIARKGWLRKDDVLNTQPLDRVRASLQRKRAAR